MVGLETGIYSPPLEVVEEAPDALVQIWAWQPAMAVSVKHLKHLWKHQTCRNFSWLQSYFFEKFRRSKCVLFTLPRWGKVCKLSGLIIRLITLESAFSKQLRFPRAMQSLSRWLCDDLICFDIVITRYLRIRETSWFSNKTFLIVRNTLRLPQKRIEVRPSGIQK